MEFLQDRYQLEELLGNGRLGELYRATDSKLSRQVAVRLLNPDLLENGEQLAKLRDSLDDVADLKHPHIGLIYHAEWEGKRPFLVTEFATRPFLSRSLPIDKWFTHAVELAAALMYGHDEVGIVHGGIQDGNVLIKEGLTHRLIVTGWGLTAVLGISDAYAPYAPPEVLAGNVPNKLSDIYSMGAVLYHSLMGEPPDRKAPRSLLEEHPKLPKVINDFVMQLLAFTPARRVPSAKEALSNLYYLIALTQNNSRFTMPHETELLIKQAGGGQRIEPMVRNLLNVGTDPHNEIVLRGGGIADHHIRLEQRGVLWYATDLGSTLGTVFDGQQMLPNSEILWQPEDVITISGYNLLWRPVSISGTRILLESLDVTAELEPAQTILTFEEPIHVQMSLTNHEETVLQGQIILSNLPSNWIKLPDMKVQLLPGESRKMRFLLHLPLDQIVVAGTYSYQIGIEVREQQFPLTVGQFSVPSQPDVDVTIKPQQLTDAESVYIKVQNRGNSPIQAQLDLRAAEKGLTFVGVPDEFALDVGEGAEFFLEVVGKRPFIGASRTTPITITTHCQPEPERLPNPQTIHFQARPRIPMWMITVFSIVTLFLCMGLLLLSQSWLRRLILEG